MGLFSDNETTAKVFFEPVKDSENKWRCRCGKILSQKKKCRWTNLITHIVNQHPEYMRPINIKIF